MRRPVTDEELEKIPVSDDECDWYARKCHALLERCEQLDIPGDPITGIAFMRVGTTQAQLLGIPREDALRIVTGAAMALDPPSGKGPVLPAIPTSEQLNLFCKRLTMVAHALYKRDPVTDRIAFTLHGATAFLKFNAWPDELVIEVFEAAWSDSIESLRRIAEKSGAVS